MAEKPSTKDNWDSGHFLALSAMARLLSIEIAKVADPTNPRRWFDAFGERVFEYIDGASNPDFKDDTEKEIKETAYGTLRMIFDPKNLKI